MTATRLSPPEVELVSRHLTRARRQVKYNGRVWSVERRFSEFDELDKELARMPAREGRTVHLPPFPSKVWVGKAAQETQDRRRRELEELGEFEPWRLVVRGMCFPTLALGQLHPLTLV